MWGKFPDTGTADMRLPRSLQETGDAGMRRLALRHRAEHVLRCPGPSQLKDVFASIAASLTGVRLSK